MILHDAGVVQAAVIWGHASERNALRRAEAVAAGFPGCVSAGGAWVRASVCACAAGRWTTGRPLLRTVEDGVQAQQLAAAAARSLETGQAVRL